MLILTIINPAGVQQGTVRTSSPDVVDSALLGSENQAVIFPPGTPSDIWDFNTFAWVSRPPRPSPDHEWVPALSQWVDQRSLAAAQEQAWERLKTAREQAIEQPFVSQGMVFDYSPLQINGAFSAAKAAFDAGQDFEVTWTLADNSFVTLSAPQMIQAGLDLVAHVNAAHEHARTKRTAIYAATSIPEVEAIEW